MKKKKKLIYFPSWPEEIKKIQDHNVERIFKQNKNQIKIVFTGNVGQAQGFEKVIHLCEKFKNVKFKVFVIGTGRWLDRIEDIVKKTNKKYKLFDTSH